ncbi:photosystem II oxygen evolving complex protein PsbP, 23 kD extrinsic protein [Crocosphaera subtropica ATCC 51142]|uniref:Photosystem II oxygen evolving complex protein PsbP, 23 kD extrinsic protein n=1 Tax=Crocosphaera subtropica (strain ATCC 51142 / BH68) TaxID=43989 RepID=B1WR97_CROS5|nr:photosystem II reaction center PsbP [Crocosphaera subtropica]ACB50155.1 photosystem II oxygen evolving complex protein PsbP, 23 kD extrinsic protein [Crocosphaera subtropica ATCC 51142]
MFKSLRVIVLTLISLTLFSCSIGLGGLQSYVDSADGYQFLYPNGWVGVDVKQSSQGVDVIFRDLIEPTENLSVIVSDVDEEKTLTALGTPTEVGYYLLKQMNNNKNNGRKVDLINAESREVEGKTYYNLEYEVTLPNQDQRHNLASIAVSRGKLFTFNLSTLQKRWDKVKDLFETSVNSFSVY